MEALLRAHQVTKVYRIYRNPKDRIREVMFRRPYHEVFVALDHVSLEVMPGRAVGVIGENGAGKSTLLSILVGVLSPTGGVVERRGKVASILDLGGGFHFDFSGRENIRMNAAMLGLDRHEVEDSIQRIIDFSELHHFIDKPVKTYSKGMFLRLAFSVAINVHPDLLVIDEVLAVGDAYFQKKCVDQIERFMADGGSIVFCSHSMYTVSQFCQTALWLKQGRVEAGGPTEEVVSAYMTYTRKKEERIASTPTFAEGKAAERITEKTVRPAWIEECSLNGRKQGDSLVFRLGDEFTIRARVRTRHPDWKFHVGVAMDRNDHLTCYAASTLSDRMPSLTGKESFELTFRVKNLPFLRGDYYLKLFLMDELCIHVLDEKSIPFSVLSEEHPWGVCYVPHEWQTD